MAAKLDLSTYSLDELDALIAEATKLKTEKVDARRAELIAELDKLGGVPAKPARSPAAKVTGDGRASPKPKYRSPDGKSEYAGKGAIPKWASDMGFSKWADLEEYRIKE